MLDRIDREIIEQLRADARSSYKCLAERVHLSPNAVAERVRGLQDSGAIQGFHADIDLRALDLALVAFIDVKLSPGITAANFETGLRTLPGIIEATLVTGSFDYLLQVACKDQGALVQLTEAMRSQGGIQETYTRILLRKVTLSKRLT